MKYTTTVTDYLTWRGDIPFSVDPFNEVDNLVLCIISYLDFSRFPELLTRNPKEAAAGSIRADFADSIDANAVHGSDSAENAAIEIAYFFPATDIYAR